MHIAGTEMAIGTEGRFTHCYQMKRFGVDTVVMNYAPEGPRGRVFAMADRARSNTVVGWRPNMVSKV